MQVHPLDHVVARGVPESDASQLYVAFEPGQVLCAGCVGHLRLGVQQLEYPYAGRHGTLQHRVLHGEVANGVEEALNVHDERDQRADRERFTRHEPGAEEYRQSYGQCGEGVYRRKHARREPGRGQIRPVVLRVQGVEVTQVLLLAVHRLNDADTGDILVEGPVDDGYRVPDADERLSGQGLP